MSNQPIRGSRADRPQRTPPIYAGGHLLSNGPVSDAQRGGVPGQPAGDPSEGWPRSQPVRVGAGGIGIAGFVCGLVGLVLFLLAPLALILGLLGLALSGSGLWLARRDGTPAGLSIAGLTCSVLAVVLSGILLIAVN
ncbi:hypothetical protein [Nakamurella aerolata]|uniref:DUF4190 domain-containing protein n=1 Tax=Nakamurella aerolata TaxID=1656892 RepID=A0A849A7N7_9ACTN|nr:hypothetical protein [Nakamurella aerolata]NNG36505.1 hypothetical protein [Nakamurella aerolata]